MRKYALKNIVFLMQSSWNILYNMHILSISDNQPKKILTNWLLIINNFILYIILNFNYILLYINILYYNNLT